METWPSGRRHSPAKGASGQNLDRKFESSRLRQIMFVNSYLSWVCRRFKARGNILYTKMYAIEMKKVTLIIISLFFMSACATNGHRQALSNLIACDDANPQSYYVFSNILIENSNSANKYELLGSTQKLNQSQKETFQLYLQHYSQCVRQFTASPNNPFLSTYQGLFNEIDVAFAGLLSGGLTIGEANKQIFEAKARFDTNLKTRAYQLQSLENQAVSNALQVQRNTTLPPPVPPPVQPLPPLRLGR